MKKIIRYLALIIMVTSMIGCSNVTITEKDELLFNKINQVQNDIEDEQWDRALKNLSEFQKNYQNRKWKMQLLAGLDDYTEIEIEMEKLKETIKEKEGLESKVGLSHIRQRMFIIYNL
ncbi:DUF4363 family protein [Anaerobacillus sp. MEB173]|uniref:DUF4363 family protein n=1 Tax=Anaerobacillus sp. MEB173 TaxID=3383345 RepID=UPI003F90AB7E